MLPHRWSIGLRAIALLELLKGGLVLFAFAMVVTGRWTMAVLTESIVRLMHLDPAGHGARFLTGTVANLEPGVLVWLAAAYVTVRLAEAYGLWRERHWGEWLAVLSAGLYVPAEIYELFRHYSSRKVAVLGLNLLIIAFLGWVLWRTRNGRRLQRDAV